MGNALPSSPPPPLPAQAESRAKYLVPLPGMKLRSPRREAGRRKAAKCFRRLLKRRGTSNVELSEKVGCQERLIRDWQSGKEGGQWGDFWAMDRRTALALLDAIRTELLTTDDADLLKPEADDGADDSDDSHR